MRERLDYLDLIGKELKPRRRAVSGAPLVYDLFAGCGGLALGFEAAGFRTVGFEMLPDACDTYRRNLRAQCHQVRLTPETDLGPAPDVVIGGPPCQPFSVNGYQNGHQDERDGFPAYVGAVERYRPKLAIFENVRGMLYRNKEYLAKIVRKLESLGYTVEEPRILNALHYGVPQNRERLIVVGHKGGWVWPNPVTTHDPYTAGEALGEMASEWDESSKFLTASMDAYVARYEKASKCIRARPAPGRAEPHRHLPQSVRRDG